jgi:hypothetical protein
MIRRFAALPVGLLGAWMLAAGCAANGSGNHFNGPVFDLDAAAGDAGVLLDAATQPGSSDAAAQTDSTIPEGGGAPDGGPTSPADAADGSDASAAADAGCTSMTAILGGNDTSSFGATATGRGPFVTHALTGGVAAGPALVAFGGGFQGLFTERFDAGGANALFGVGFSGGAWGTPSALGGSAGAIDAPSVAAVGTTLQAVYLNAEHLYFHAAFGTGWDTGADPVRPSDAGATAFGPVRAAAAGTSTELVIVYEGNDSHPYAQTWTTGAGWDDGVALGAAPLLADTPMAIAALDTGASDLLAVYVDGEGPASTNNEHLFFAVRSGTTKAWSAPAMVDVNAYTPSAPTLAAMSGGRALLAWQGGDGASYASVYTAPVWSSAAKITSDQVASAPSLAPGVCGDDAVAAYPLSGAVYVTHLAGGGAWTTPAPLAGVAGVTAASIATAP